jgi:hypothetical protein
LPLPKQGQTFVLKQQEKKMKTYYINFVDDLTLTIEADGFDVIENLIFFYVTRRGSNEKKITRVVSFYNLLYFEEG